MEYKGKLYGKVGNRTFPLLHTTDDWEKMENRIKELESENEALKQANGVEITYKPELHKHDVIKSVCCFEGDKDSECWKVLGRCICCEHYKQNVL